MSAQPQSFENHAKMVPAFHYVGSPLLLVLIVWSVVKVVRDPGVDAAMGVILMVTLTIGFFYARLFALGVQDRVIRLEERMRMERILPEDMRSKIESISTEALIGLRFASDEELPALTRRVLDGELTDRKQVKAAVKSWRADHQRI